MPYINTAERIGIEKGLLLGRQEGRQEGGQQSRLEIALNLIKLGSLDDKQIAAVTQLDLREVLALRQQSGEKH